MFSGGRERVYWVYRGLKMNSKNLSAMVYLEIPKFVGATIITAFSRAQDPYQTSLNTRILISFIFSFGNFQKIQNLGLVFALHQFLTDVTRNVAQMKSSNVDVCQITNVMLVKNVVRMDVIWSALQLNYPLNLLLLKENLVTQETQERGYAVLILLSTQI